MRNELMKIALQLLEWCKKYDKDYASVAILPDSIMATVRVDDKDYKECNIWETVEWKK